MRYSHVLGSIVGLAAATAAQAVMSVSIVPVVTAGELSGVRTYDLKVTTTAAAEWVSADLQFSLVNAGNLSGSFYNDARVGAAGQRSPLDLNAAAAANKYDTWVTSPERFVATGSEATPFSVEILGKAQYPSESGTGAAIFPAAASGNTQVDAAWGSVYPLAAAGEHTIARFSVIGNTGANISGRIGYKNNTSAPLTFSNLYLPILGDTNMDRVVDQVDNDLWLANLDEVGPGNATTGDTNLDGIVDQVDNDLWLLNLDNTLPAAGSTLGAVVPEPTSLGLIGAGLLLAARRRRA